MYSRLLKLPKNANFFLFGARNTGKSTLLKETFVPADCLWIDLLDPNEELRFTRDPSELERIVEALPEDKTHVVVDEVQKIPKLLDVCHRLIERKKKYFVFSGSSARKLKYGGANLLAGRAFVYSLYPFSCFELDANFKLDDALRFGLLPQIYNYENEEEKILFLHAYTQTYLKEEIWAEQFVKQLDPFRKFLEVAAQSNGKIVNYSNISRDVGIDVKIIKEYFQILEDTLIGFFLEPFHHSFRKRLNTKPKFYFFDTGVVRALTFQLSVPIQKQTYDYGHTFEHFILLECKKLASYFHSEFRFSFLRTKDDAEIDLIVERPGQKILFIEIKSSDNVSAMDLRTFTKLADDFGDCEAVCFSNDPYSKKIGTITVYPWREGLKTFFYKSE